MAKILDLQAEPRNVAGTSAVKRLRKAGIVPAALYGRKAQPTNLQVHGKTFSKLLETSASDNILVSLKIEGGSEQLALVQEVQHDYLRGGILHVDFHAVVSDEEIHANVPVVTVGESPGQKLGGLIEFLHHEVEVHCLPKDLPGGIEVDISELQLGQAVHIGDMKFPDRVTPRLGADVVIIMCVEPKVDAAATTAAAPAADAPSDAAKK